MRKTSSKSKAKSTANTLDIEKRITELEAEVKHALFPITRESFEESMRNYSISDDIARMQGIDVEDRRANPSKYYLYHLEYVKQQKDENSTIWQKMRNWD